jgi:DNA protecting protein DprA
MLGRGLCAAGVTVVSGLALGVDAAAHRGALAAGDAAIAVLACGADVAYPPSHRGLYERIRSRGVVVSELPPGTPPMRWSFPARNRLMAALGELTVVVEAKERSGSLITATFAEQLGRDVGAVPGQVTGKRAAGSNRLLRDGARVIRGPEDVLDELFGIGEGAAVGPSGDDRRPVDATEAAQDGAKRAGVNGDGEAGELRRRREHLAAALEAPSGARDLEPRARRVLEAVEAGHGVEAIGAAARLSAAEVRAALGRLELVGLVARDGLGTYQRTGRGT